MIRILSVLMALCLCVGILPACAENAPLTGKTASEIVSDMGFGWNLGNSLDATGGNASDIYSQETSWGNPRIDPELFPRVKAAGFDTIRIPTTWYRHVSRDGSYTIDSAWMDRVEEVVKSALDADLYVILNFHHEEWINDPKIDENYVKIGEQLAAMWQQVADRFAQYDQRLIFEGLNEPRAQGTDYEWNGNAACYEAVNYLNQVFVDTVRGNGQGYNNERCLMIPMYAASSNAMAMKAMKIPQVNGEYCNNLIISVHSYAPYNFCLSDAQMDFSLKNNSDTMGAKNVFYNVQYYFLKRGIPVVLSETSATNKNNDAARGEWMFLMGQTAAKYGIPMILWDNGYTGSSGGECHAWIRRKVTGDQESLLYPEILERLWEGKNSVTWGELQ